MPVSASEKAARRARRRAFEPNPAPILFVGGTGRSGTHVIARLISRSEHYGLVPVECRFHTDDDGFPGLLAGEVSKSDFLRRLRGFWWRGFQTNRLRGLHRFVPRERFDRAVEAFDEAFDREPEAACRRLFLDLLWPVTEAGDGRPADGIVEQSCDVVAQAPTLVRLFPEARFVHVVRDGRDASASRVAQTRRLVYPRNRRQGLEWWEARIRRIDEGARAIPDDRLLEIELGAFLTRGRREQLRSLAGHAGILAGNRLKRFVRRRMSGRAANQERWRQGISEPEQPEIESLYREALGRLERDGIRCAPLLRHAYERTRPR
jgi:Sulfotransferase family